jgi:hypothetical protein
MMAVVRSLSLLAGYCYTQLTDTYQEANGLLYSDRTPKIPVEQINHANRGSQATREDQLQHLWEERMQHFVREQHIASPEAAWVEASYTSPAG